MPSPLGHALGGVAAAWAVDLSPVPRASPSTGSTPSSATAGYLTLIYAGLGALPDVDLMFGIPRTASHSILASVLVGIIAALVTGRVTPRLPAHRIAWMCGAAYGSHLLLDWLAVDRFPPSGIQLLWP